MPWLFSACPHLARAASVALVVNGGGVGSGSSAHESPSLQRCRAALASGRFPNACLHAAHVEPQDSTLSEGKHAGCHHRCAPGGLACC